MLATALAFLTTTAIGRFVGRVLLAAVLFGGGYGYGRIEQALTDHSAEKIAALQSELAAAKADADIAAVLHGAVQDQLTKLEEEHSGLSRQVSEYEEAVSKLEAERRTCRAASDDDVKRLRAIR